MKYCLTTKNKSCEPKSGTMVTSLLLAYFSIFLMLGTSEAGTVNGITGTVTDGQTITIKGSGFGSSGPNVVLFDDFESGTVGANIKTGAGSAKFGQWAARAGSSFYGNTAKVSGTKSFTSDYSKSYSNMISAKLPAGTRSVFASWWLFVPAGKNFPGEGTTDGDNWKQMWLLGKDSVSNDFYWPARLATGWIIAGNDPVSGAARSYPTVNMVKGEWKRVWGWIKGSDNVEKKGEIKFWELQSSGVTQRVNKTGLYNLKAGGQFEKINPNGYGRQTPNCLTSFDDIYMATGPNAQARVEVGNASTYTSSTKLTILTPKSWSDGSISAQVNTGQFKSGESAYLFVFKADGSVSSGYPIKIGATSSTTSDQAPSLNFTAPTTGSTYTTEITDIQKIITIAGTASDDYGVQSVTYTTNNGQSGNATSGSTSTNWSVPIVVNKDTTVISTITATDNAGQKTSKTMTLTGASTSTSTNLLSWNAKLQTGDSTWANSTYSYCVRLLVQGKSIANSGDKIALGFQGRASGNYSMRSVSIAERDTAGKVGDVIDGTWKKVLFDGTAWNSNVTVAAGKEKLSNTLDMNLKPGTDYYVTYKLVTPSTYLQEPSENNELYFSSADHSSDLDWGNDGFSLSKNVRAFSKIYIR